MEKLMHPLTIFLGDIQEYLSVVAKQHSKSAWLLDHSNYTKIFDSNLNLSPTTVYTSLGDLPKDLKIVYSILSKADQIYFCPPEKWSDGKSVDISFPGDSVQGLTGIMLSLLPDSVIVHDMSCSLPNPDPLIDTRKTDQSQLWIAGCSISHGVGVDCKEKYGQLVANEMNLSCSFLTRPGSAIDWAADQILRSDIQKEDIVIFGITNPDRLTYIHDNQLLSGVTGTTYDRFPEYHSIVNPKNLFSHQTLYTHYYSIQKVINFCKQIKATLILIGLLPGAYNFINFLKSQKNYIHVPYTLEFNKSQIKTSFIDLGTDLEHPGPKQHIQYKQLILDKIDQLNIT